MVGIGPETKPRFTTMLKVANESTEVSYIHTHTHTHAHTHTLLKVANESTD